MATLSEPIFIANTHDNTTRCFFQCTLIDSENIHCLVQLPSARFLFRCRFSFMLLVFMGHSPSADAVPGRRRRPNVCGTTITLDRANRRWNDENIDGGEVRFFGWSINRQRVSVTSDWVAKIWIARSSSIAAGRPPTANEGIRITGSSSDPVAGQ